MNNTGSIAIPFSKKKLSRLLIISVVFAVLGPWMLLSPTEEGNRLINNPIVKNGVAIGAILLGLLGMAITIQKLLRKQAALLIDDNGITDHSSPTAAGYVPWNDVHLITTATVVNQKFVVLIVKNPECYIQRKKNFIGKKGMRMNFKNYGSPICISASGLQCTTSELIEMIERKLSAYKSRGAVHPI